MDTAEPIETVRARKPNREEVMICVRVALMTALQAAIAAPPDVTAAKLYTREADRLLRAIE